jgi:hypothetical protein
VAVVATHFAGELEASTVSFFSLLLSVLDSELSWGFSFGDFDYGDELGFTLLI